MRRTASSTRDPLHSGRDVAVSTRHDVTPREFSAEGRKKKAADCARFLEELSRFHPNAVQECGSHRRCVRTDFSEERTEIGIRHRGRTHGIRN
jgi:hypothetical protein